MNLGRVENFFKYSYSSLSAESKLENEHTLVMVSPVITDAELLNNVLAQAKMVRKCTCNSGKTKVKIK